MSNSRGYLLPPGEAFEDSLGCCLVFYPDRDEYRRALFGSLDYLGTWVAWERDELKRGRDAALSWKLANEATRECCSMGFCDELLTKLDRIIALLSLLNVTGDSSVTYGDITTVVTTIVPDSGAPPATWGDSIPIADWDEWKEYVCYHAHEWVDDLVAKASIIQDVWNLGNLTFDFLGDYLGYLSYRFHGQELPLPFDFLSNIFGGLGAFLDIVDMSSIGDDLEAVRDDLICAILLDGDLAGEVENAVGSLAWLALYQWIDYDSLKAVIYEGGYQEGSLYLSPVKRNDCICDDDREPGQLIHNSTWDIDYSKWDIDCGYWECLNPHPTGNEPGTLRGPSLGDDVPTEAIKTLVNFTIPDGITEVQFETRVILGSNARKPVCQLYDASDDSLIGHRNDSYTGSGWQTRDVGSPIPVVPGTECYAICWGVCDGLANKYSVSHIKLWTVSS